MPSKIESVDEAAVNAETFARENGLPDEVISAIDLAIRESVANAVKHGNKLDATKNVDVTLTHSGETFDIAVRDYGEGFVPTEIPDPTDPANLLNASGRGILFMRSFMDTVEWSEHPQGGMVVSMTKRL